MLSFKKLSCKETLWQVFLSPSFCFNSTPLPNVNTVKSTCLTILFSLSLLQVCTQNPVGVYFTAFLNYVNVMSRICVILREVIRYPLQKFCLYREQNIILRANIFHYVPLLCGTVDSHRVSEWSSEPEFITFIRNRLPVWRAGTITLFVVPACKET
jgi:hypothetical protein